MKIAVSAIKPNPFRDMGRYKLDETKIQSLMTSINKTGFWDNVILRPGPGCSVVSEMIGQDFDGGYLYEDIAVGKEVFENQEDADVIIHISGGEYHSYENPTFELAYGHHRLEAVKRVGLEEIDVPINNIADTNMLQMMADENAEQYHASTAMVNETILAVRNFISKEIGENKRLEDLPDSVRGLFDTQKALNAVWQSSVGQLYHARIGHTVIEKFLGGTWGERTIKAALRILDAEGVDRDVAESFSKQRHADAFTDTIETNSKAYGIKLDSKEQAEIVEEIIDEVEKDPNQELTVAVVRSKTAEKIRDKKAPIMQARKENQAPIVQDAHWVNALKALSIAKTGANHLPALWEVPENRRGDYVDKINMIIETLTDKLKETIHG